MNPKLFFHNCDFTDQGNELHITWNTRPQGKHTQSVIRMRPSPAHKIRKSAAAKCREPRASNKTVDAWLPRHGRAGNTALEPGPRPAPIVVTKVQ